MEHVSTLTARVLFSKCLQPLFFSWRDEIFYNSANQHQKCIYITMEKTFANLNSKTVKGKSKAPIEEEDEEAELAKLQAEMAM